MAVSDRLAAAGLIDVTLTVRPAGRHEVFNDTTRDEVTTDALAWLDRVLPPT
jgi:alpha-beta hydrolase superfamily lysophospholipase